MCSLNASGVSTAKLTWFLEVSFPTLVVQVMWLLPVTAFSWPFCTQFPMSWMVIDLDFSFPHKLKKKAGDHQLSPRWRVKQQTLAVVAWADLQDCRGNFQWLSHPRWLIKISQSGKGAWAVLVPHWWITKPLEKDALQIFLPSIDTFFGFGPQKGRFHYAIECFHFLLRVAQFDLYPNTKPWSCLTISPYFSPPTSLSIWQGKEQSLFKTSC